MNLRRKDDWDEALEEERNDAIQRGKIKPNPLFVPGPDYDYGISIVIPISKIIDEDLNNPSS